MLKLNLRKKDYWITLPGQVKVKVKPISTALMSAAQMMALDAYRVQLESGELNDVSDTLRKGLSESMLIKSLAQISIIEWEGVLQADSDDPAPVNDHTVSQLMDIWLIAQDFLKQYVVQFKLLVTEGNVSAPAATGTSAAEALTASSAA